MTRHVPDNKDTRQAVLLRSRTARLPHPGHLKPKVSYLTSSPVSARPISTRWISDVPSKIVKILEVTGRVIGIATRPLIGLSGRRYRCPFQRCEWVHCRTRSLSATHAGGAPLTDGILSS